MEQEIYKRLAKHLDNLPGGFPPTESGVEMRILRRLFTRRKQSLPFILHCFPKNRVSLRAGPGCLGMGPPSVWRRWRKRDLF